VIGEIMAGILLGPTVLGRIAPGAPERLFPAAVPLRSIADLGLIFFMFLVGLELDTRMIAREGRRALWISLSGLLGPLVFGILIGIPLIAVNNAGVFVTKDRPASPIAFPLFLGAAMCITAFPVLARILVERGLYKTALGTAALCAAAVDDVFAWILLAAVVGLTRTGSAQEAVVTFVLTLAFLAFMVFVGRRLLNVLAGRYEALGQLSADQVAVVLAAVLLSAFTTEWIGIHAIFGGFVFGTVMPKHSRLTEELADKVEDFTVVVLLPVFFCVAGLRTNLLSLNSAQLLGWLALILVVAIGGKLIGCGVAARLNGFSTHDAIVMGTLMNTRGLTELVILSVGQGLGVLSDRTFAMMVIMALVTTFMATPIINRLIPRRRMVAMLAGGEPQPVAVRVLVALGNPVNAPHLVDAAVLLTGSRRPAELLLVRLVPTPRAPEFRTGLREEESQVDASVEAMRGLVREAEAKGVTARCVSFLSDAVGPDLIHTADTQHCDMILLGWHRPSLARHVIRENVHLLFRRASAGVGVFVDRQGNGVRADGGGPVVVAQSGGVHDEAASEAGLRLAESLKTSTVRVPLTAGDGHTLAAAVQQSLHAPVGVVGLGPDWAAGDFGGAASSLAEGAGCPVYVVRGRSTEEADRQMA